MIDQLLSKVGLKFEDLKPVEQETLNTWLKALQNSTVTTEKIRMYIEAMRNSVEEELSKEPEYIQTLFFRTRNDKNILLKARLRNYMLLDAFLMSPEHAKRQLEQAVAGMVNSVKA